MKKTLSRALCSLMTVMMVFCLTSVVSLAEDAGQWNSYRGNYQNNGVTSARTARTADEADLKWELALKDSTDWSTNVSDPIQVNGTVYVAVGSELWAVNSSGEVTGRGTLDGAIGYTCRLMQAEGKVVVPLSDGRLQCLDMDSLKPVWITDPVVTQDQEGQTRNHQALTTITYSDGLLYTGTAYADWSSSYSGVYQCVEVSTGRIVWQYENTQAGYYWSGAVCVNNAVIFAGDDGIVTSLNAKTGDLIDEMETAGGVRSSMVLEGNEVFFSSQDGKLHKVTVGDDGTLSQHEEVAFAQSSTSTPAVYDGKVYVGGALGPEQQYAGVLAVVDASTMQVEKTVNAPADVKSAPLVTKAYGDEAYVYYTANKTPGGIYVLKSGADEGEDLFVPTGDGQNYCLASIMADGDGTLYYTNDSGKLFAVASHVPEEGGDDQSGSSSESQQPSQSAPSEDDGSVSSNPSSAEESSSSSASTSSSTVNNPPTGENSAAFLVVGMSALTAGVAWICSKRRNKEA